jgi:plasmid stability protein
MIQIRHVPEEIHRRLKARAALEGLSLSDYLLREVSKLGSQPTLDEMRARLARLSPVRTRASTATLLRQERDRR